MPRGIVERSRTTAHPTLRATLHRGLKMFKEGDTSGMERFAIANRAAQCAQTTGVNADTRALTHIFNNRTRGRIDRI